MCGMDGFALCGDYNCAWQIYVFKYFCNTKQKVMQFSKLDVKVEIMSSKIKAKVTSLSNTS